MPTEWKTDSERLADYINGQVDQIHTFEKEYEKDTGIILGGYPYYTKEGNPVKRQYDPSLQNEGRDREIEDYIQTRIEEEADFQQQLDPVDKTLYRETMPKNSEPVNDILSIIEKGYGPHDDHSHIDHEYDDVMRIIEPPVEGAETSSENPTLRYVKQKAEQEPGSLQPSPWEKQVGDMLKSMGAHYEQVPRPSDEMEKLISQAEQDARHLDLRLSRVLELEEQGAENPLREQERDQEQEPQVESNTQESKERSLLKDLYRRHYQQPSSKTGTKNVGKTNRGPELD